MVETIVLAGGKSSRFQTNKMSQMIDDKPLLLHTLKTYLEVSEKVVIVTGFYDVDYLLDYIKHPKLEIVQNNNHELGMFSSVLTGVKHVSKDFLLTPGDYPFVQKETIQKLLDEKGDIRVPVYKGRKGHPIFIKGEFITELLESNIDSNLKIFRDKHNVTYVDVLDKGVIHDVDYWEDLSNMNAERNE